METTITTPPAAPPTIKDAQASKRIEAATKKKPEKPKKEEKKPLHVKRKHKTTISE